jgi:hypothetical protein
MSSSSPSSPEELGARIGELAETIKQAKAEKKPKEEWEPFLQEMLACKVCIESTLRFVCWLQC